MGDPLKVLLYYDTDGRPDVVIFLGNISPVLGIPVVKRHQGQAFANFHDHESLPSDAVCPPEDYGASEGTFLETAHK